MSEKNEAAGKPRGCGRGEELVAYLYGETTKEEAALFRGHLDACAICREELAALGGVREGLAAWRAEALGTVPSLNIQEALAPAAQALPAAPRIRSARAALREFFSLSPLWLRAGAFAATLAVCALIALTLTRAEIRWDADGLAFRAGVTERVVKERVEVPVPGGYTDEQVNALVARQVAQAKEQAAAETEARLKKQARGQVINVVEKRPAHAPPQRRKRPTHAGTRGDEMLAADDNLPRLSDLLGGSY
ncbi:MAG TPA: zf-HC2 domain-containing protein [Pyrinomonadaceae bacterium]|nr:zf-HC2 domain-containing protein [Pyrinomonadaceae bacterium]